MKQITKILIIILIGSLLSGCVESDNLSDLADLAGLQDDQLRASDEFEIVWYNVFDDESYWEVTTLTSYPPYENMIDDERHGLTLGIKHYYSIREAHDTMNDKRSNPRRHSQNSTVTNLTYSASSYKIESYIENPNEPITTAVNIIIQKNKVIGTISVGGYSNMDECNEVADYYGSIMNEMLESIP